MTTEATAAPRANRDGDPCPGWCTTDHGEPLVTGRPDLGYVKTHRSDAMTGQLWPTGVKVSAYPGEAAKVELHRMAIVELAPERAIILAGVIEATAKLGEAAIAQLADELRAAAAIARETR